MNEINIKPLEILTHWQQNLNEGNLSGVLRLYDLSCVLIPTFSSDILTDHEQIKEYFVNVIEVQKGSVQFQQNSISQHPIGKNMFLLCGIYFFNLMEKGEIPARFSFLISPFLENPIKHHHSSRSISN
jgi:Uncharacterized protein conserved in bacteria with a cystatin-like fold